MDIIKLLDIPTWQLLSIIAVGATIMFSFDYVAPMIGSSIFFSATNGNQPMMIMMEESPLINSALLGEIIAIATVFSWLTLRQRIKGNVLKAPI